MHPSAFYVCRPQQAKMTAAGFEHWTGVLTQGSPRQRITVGKMWRTGTPKASQALCSLFSQLFLKNSFLWYLPQTAYVSQTSLFKMLFLTQLMPQGYWFCWLFIPRLCTQSACQGKRWCRTLHGKHPKALWGISPFIFQNWVSGSR